MCFYFKCFNLRPAFFVSYQCGKKLNDMKLTGASNVQFVVIFVVLGFEIENRN